MRAPSPTSSRSDTTSAHLATPGAHLAHTLRWLRQVAQVYQAKRLELAEAHVAYFLRASLEAVAFLHQLGRVHRDIKSDNLLINTRGQVKMADFGFCVQLTQEKDMRQSMVTLVGCALGYAAIYGSCHS